ncbi:MAG: hypothetical protein AAGK97_17140, partial [Bacteroidota bacterium]
NIYVLDGSLLYIKGDELLVTDEFNIEQGAALVSSMLDLKTKQLINNGLIIFRSGSQLLVFE